MCIRDRRSCSCRRAETYACGDMNTSVLRTARGRTVLLQHDVVTPRPYTRINHVAGTKGAFRDYPPRLFLDGAQEKGHARWGSLKEQKKRFEHPLWTKLARAAKKGGHGGMDYVMSWRMMQCVREGLVPDMDVYDAAAWSAAAPRRTRPCPG